VNVACGDQTTLVRFSRSELRSRYPAAKKIVDQSAARAAVSEVISAE
jgi:hypothetical protein